MTLVFLLNYRTKNDSSAYSYVTTEADTIEEATADARYALDHHADITHVDIESCLVDQAGDSDHYQPVTTITR